MIVGDMPRNPLICIIWMLILGWIFLGVALGADVFMTSIEVITSKEKSIKKTKARRARQQDPRARARARPPSPAHA